MSCTVTETEPYAHLQLQESGYSVEHAQPSAAVESVPQALLATGVSLSRFLSVSALIIPQYKTRTSKI